MKQIARWVLILLTLLGSQSLASELPEGFVYLKDIAPDIEEDIRYAGSENFIGRPIAGYLAGRCILTRQAAEALQSVQEDVKHQGLSLKVYDCYRPQKAVDDFVQWSNNLSDQANKPVYYPRVDKSKLFELGYIAEKSGHSRGSTVDVTVVPRVKTNPPKNNRSSHAPCFAPERLQDNSLDMGTAYDCFDPLAHTLNPEITGQPQLNRLLLKSAMERRGFRNLPEEWWHYTLENEPFPDQFFNFDVR